MSVSIVAVGVNCCRSKRGQDDILDDDLNTLNPGDARLKLAKDTSMSKILEGGEEGGQQHQGSRRNESQQEAEERLEREKKLKTP